MTRGIFVSGTDTGVGKTLVSAGLLSALGQKGYRTAAMKPVASGAVMTPEGLRNDDALTLLRAASVTLPYDKVNPYVFMPPVAPHIAAHQAGIKIELGDIVAIYKQLALAADVTVVEGVGGWKVPLNRAETTADLARALALPVILVVAIRLGCINHALLSAESIAATGLPLIGWVANCNEPDLAEKDVIKALNQRLDAPLLGVLPRLECADATVAARHLKTDLLLKSD